MTEDRLCIGVIAGAHGVRGDLRIKSFTTDPQDLAAYGPLTDITGARVFRVRLLGAAGGLLRAHIDGIGDRDAAEAVAGTELYIDRAALPPTEEDEYYHSDLIGLRAETGDGTGLGTVRALYDFGAGDVVEIALAAGGTLVLPFTHAAVPSVDPAAGRIVVVLPEEVEARAPKTGRDAQVSGDDA